MPPAETEEKSRKSTRTEFLVRLENLSHKVTAYRKIVLDILVMLLVMSLIVFLVITSFRQKILILPVEIPEKLERAGYTPAFFTEKILDRIGYIKRTASSYYKNNDIALTTADENVEVVDNLVSNTPLEGFKGMIMDFVNRNQRKAYGKVMAVDDQLQITFRIDGIPPVMVQQRDVDSIIIATAEYIMEEIDPYSLSAFYFQTGKYEKCLPLVQRLLNDNKSEYRYLAFHIRGNVYIEMGNYYQNERVDTSTRWLGRDYFIYAKAIIDSAIATNKLRSPWLTYNSMGALYHNRGIYDTAKIWYRRSMIANLSGANAYHNYGNIMLGEFIEDSVKYASYLDSAVVYFKDAIKRNTSNIQYQVDLLKAYAYGRREKEAKEVFFKCMDIDPDNLDLYTNMGILYMFLDNREMVRQYDEMRGRKKNVIPVDSN